ncbi:MAG: hypothetical protein V4514_14575 [Pseudomonadota bacterium]|uniref:hypothetical protein n=1 Tax=Phenylobacterium sp. TaxID=1871053 RepID=UPI0025E0013C|nr:hypothetical protein [Phenylobacterium sp.]MBT9471052.1 hypothetical protein [Phenylobacterium sp.]
MQRNKVYSVTVIAAVAQELGVDEDLLHDISIGMEPEDGVIRVYGIGEDSITAFTNEGVDELKNLLEAYRRNPNLFR